MTNQIEEIKRQSEIAHAILTSPTADASALRITDCLNSLIAASELLQQQQWQPIETCPKDETWFLGLIEGIPYQCKAFMNHGVVNYHWCMHINMAGGQTLRVERSDDGTEKRIQIKEADAPKYEAKVLGYKLGMNHIPTHWQPYQQPKRGGNDSRTEN